MITKVECLFVFILFLVANFVSSTPLSESQIKKLKPFFGVWTATNPKSETKRHFQAGVDQLGYFYLLFQLPHKENGQGHSFKSSGIHPTMKYSFPENNEHVKEFWFGVDEPKLVLYFTRSDGTSFTSEYFLRDGILKEHERISIQIREYTYTKIGYINPQAGVKEQILQLAGEEPEARSGDSGNGSEADNVVFYDAFLRKLGSARVTFASNMKYEYVIKLADPYKKMRTGMKNRMNFISVKTKKQDGTNETKRIDNEGNTIGDYASKHPIIEVHMVNQNY